MTPLLLVAAGGLAREAIEAVRARDPERPVRVVDDDERTWGRDLHGAPVVGGLGAVDEHRDHDVVVCAGRGVARRALVERLTSAGVGPERYATVVHPDVSVPESCTVGAGSVLLAGVTLTSDVRIGRHVVVMPRVTLTHDDVVDDFATLCAGVSLGGWVRVGSGAYLGMNASVREGLGVGPDAILGMGAALTADLPARATWVGVPAGPISHAREAIA